MEIARALRTSSVLARPNGRMVALADEMLGRSGRLVRALEETSRTAAWIDAEENEPFFFPSVYKAAP